MIMSLRRVTWGSRMELGIGQIQDQIWEAHWGDWVSKKADHILVMRKSLKCVTRAKRFE